MPSRRALATLALAAAALAPFVPAQAAAPGRAPGAAAAPAAAGAPGLAPSLGAPAVEAPGRPALSVVDAVPLSARLTEYTVESPALGGRATVRVQLPTGYDDVDSEGEQRRWPMALLLHGRSENGTTWSERTDLEHFDGMVVVMPDGGQVGWYTDWYDDSCCGPLRQQWESFHIGELLPWAERTFRLAPGRSQRFVAGDSMGGFGAMSYAARHPGLFGGAAELSGFVDLMLLEVSGRVGVDGQSWQVAGVPPGSIFGPLETEEVRWRARNPVDLAENLRHTDLVLRHGNGLPAREGESLDAGESAIRLTGLSLHKRLTSLGIDHVWDDYGAGVHTWPYWEEGLRRTWPRWLAIAAENAPAPTVFEHRRVEPAWSVHGWDVALDRAVLETAVLRVDGPHRFSLTGSGAATVVTAPAFQPAGRYVATVDGVETELRADARGRLTVRLDLGPSHTAQQHTPVADAAQLAQGDGYWRTVTVEVARG